MNNISKSKTIAMNLIGYDAREAQKESGSVFQGKDYQILVARQHEGDENGKTTCTFASLSLEGTGLPEWITGVMVQKVRDVKVKESKSDIQCADGEVIMGRTHIGDENGETTYSIGEVIVLVKAKDDMYLKAKGCCVHVDKKEKTCKESKGVLMEAEEMCIVGRKHQGDENKDTTYTFAKIAIEISSLVSKKIRSCESKNAFAWPYFML